MQTTPTTAPSRERNSSGDHAGWKSVDVDLRCSWCGREVSRARGMIHRATARLLLDTEDARINVAQGRPRCRVCGGPLLLEDWKAEEAKDLLDMLAELLARPDAASQA